MYGVSLALGTVQFGVAYGVAGRGETVPEDEVRSILARAARGGIHVLDTAPVYGDIEARLPGLIGDLDFEIVSKVPPVPESEPDAAADFVEHSMLRSAERLGSHLTTILFHRAEDLLGPNGDRLWRAAESASGGRIHLGASCYSPDVLAALCRRYPVAVAQLPGNAFDQRLADAGIAEAIHGVDIHLRSVFLQGLLVMPPSRAAARVPAAAQPIEDWTRWCADRRLQPLSAALGIAINLPGVHLCVIGVDRVAQLEEILAAWDTIIPISAPALACASLDVIDPRQWIIHERS